MTCTINPTEIANMVVGKPNGPNDTSILSPSLHSMITSFNQDGKDDRALFLALLSAKTAEDQRLMALDNFRAEQLRAANTLYAHSAYQAQQLQNQQNLQNQQQQQQQGTFWFNPNNRQSSSSSNTNTTNSRLTNNNPRTPISPPSTSTSLSTVSTTFYSRENSQTPSQASNFSEVPFRSTSNNKLSKRKAINEEEESRPTSSSGYSSSAATTGIEREEGNFKKPKSNSSQSNSNFNKSKPSHEEAMNALRARCERNNKTREVKSNSSSKSNSGKPNSRSILSIRDVEQVEEGGATLQKTVSLPLSTTSSSSNSSAITSTFSPALSSVSTSASSTFFSPSLTTSPRSQLSREESKFLAISSTRPSIELSLPSSSTSVKSSTNTTTTTTSPTSSSMSILRSTEGVSSSASLRRLLNVGNERTTITRVSDIRGE